MAKRRLVPQRAGLRQYNVTKGAKQQRKLVARNAGQELASMLAGLKPLFDLAKSAQKAPPESALAQGIEFLRKRTVAPQVVSFAPSARSMLATASACNIVLRTAPFDGVVPNPANEVQVLNNLGNCVVGERVIGQQGILSVGAAVGDAFDAPPRTITILPTGQFRGNLAEADMVFPNLFGPVTTPMRVAIAAEINAGSPFVPPQVALIPAFPQLGGPWSAGAVGFVQLAVHRADTSFLAASYQVFYSGMLSNVSPMTQSFIPYASGGCPNTAFTVVANFVLRPTDGPITIWVSAVAAASGGDTPGFAQPGGSGAINFRVPSTATVPGVTSYDAHVQICAVTLVACPLPLVKGPNPTA